MSCYSIFGENENRTFGEEEICPVCGSDNILYYLERFPYNTINEFYKFKTMMKYLEGIDRALYLLQFALQKKQDDGIDIFPSIPFEEVLNYYVTALYKSRRI